MGLGKYYMVLGYRTLVKSFSAAGKRKEKIATCVIYTFHSLTIHLFVYPVRFPTMSSLSPLLLSGTEQYFSICVTLVKGEYERRRVARTTLKIVASMKRDWMQTGRKPSGICGAALFISSLSHGFTYSKSDVVKIVHICEATLTKRLVEFENTELGSLTIEEFEKAAKEFEKESSAANLDSGTQEIEMLCQHKGQQLHFAHGLCHDCYKEVISLPICSVPLEFAFSNFASCVLYASSLNSLEDWIFISIVIPHDWKPFLCSVICGFSLVSSSLMILDPFYSVLAF